MKKSKFSEQQIALILRQAEEGMTVKEVCRKAGISVQTYYRWRSKYGGLMPWEMKRLSSSRKRMSDSSGWWQTSAWTRRCCRTLSAEKCKA